MKIIFLIGILIIAAVFLYQELRFSSRRRWINLCVKGLIIFCFVILLLDQNEKQNTGTSILLTPGYDSEIRDNLKDKFPEATIYNSNSVLPNYSEKLFVLGVGIPADEFKLINAEEVSWFPPEQMGLPYLAYTADELYPGDELLLSANLLSDNIIINSVWEEADTITSSSLWSSKAPGPGNYLLKVDDINLHVKVNNRNKKNILIVTRQPDFRTKFLKNYLGKEGHKILWEAEVSKGIYHRQRINNESFTARLNSENIKDYHLLIYDPQKLKSLSSGEKDVLRKAIQDGLGLLILPLEGYSDVFKDWSLSVNNIVAEEEDKIQKLYFDISYSPLIVDSENEYVFYTYYGRGKVGSFKLANEFFWQLSGETKEYSNLWSYIVNSLSGNEKKVKVEVATIPAMVDHEVKIKLLFEDEELPSLKINEVQVPLRQDIYWSNIWYASYWPVDTGWHQLRINDDVAKYIYVQESSRNSNLLYSDILNFNKKYWNNINKPNTSENTTNYTYWILLLLVLCFGYLWLEPKL